MEALEVTVARVKDACGWGYSPDAPVYTRQKQAVRAALLAAINQCQAITEPREADRCNGACDCPYGLLRAMVEKGTA